MRATIHDEAFVRLQCNGVVIAEVANHDDCRVSSEAYGHTHVTRVPRVDRPSVMSCDLPVSGDITVLPMREQA